MVGNYYTDLYNFFREEPYIIDKKISNVIDELVDVDTYTGTNTFSPDVTIFDDMVNKPMVKSNKYKTIIDNFIDISKNIKQSTDNKSKCWG